MTVSTRTVLLGPWSNSVWSVIFHWTQLMRVISNIGFFGSIKISGVGNQLIAWTTVSLKRKSYIKGHCFHVFQKMNHLQSILIFYLINFISKLIVVQSSSQSSSSQSSWTNVRSFIAESRTVWWTKWIKYNSIICESLMLSYR